MKIINKILIVFLAALSVSCGVNNDKKYVLSAEETLNAYLNKDDILSPEKLANIILCEFSQDKYQFIDLRNPHEFMIDHIPNAINIPAKDILKDENLHILNQGEKINIIYCKKNCVSVNAYIMLKQLNYKNIKVALGGFEFINNYVINKYGIKTGVYDDEMPRYNFLRLIAESDMPTLDSIKKPAVIVKNPNKVIKDFDENCPDLN